MEIFSEKNKYKISFDLFYFILFIKCHEISLLVWTVLRKNIYEIKLKGKYAAKCMPTTFRFSKDTITRKKFYKWFFLKLDLFCKFLYMAEL